jgi:hypothetical protein
MRSYRGNSSRKIEYLRKVENRQKLTVANLPSMFLSIVDVYEHLWPIQSLQLLLHIHVRVKYFVQPDLDELSAGITEKSKQEI